MLRQILTLIIIFFTFCCFAQQKISADFQNESLDTVIQQLEKDYGLVFSFTQQLINNQSITVVIENQELETALTTILSNTNLDFKVVNKTFIVLKKSAETDEIWTLCGTIMDTEGQALPFANIFLSEIQQGISADENGFFEFTIPKNFQTTVEFSYVGYGKKQLPTTQLIDCPTITLALQTFSFSEIIVKEYLTEGIEQSEDLDHVVMHPDKIDVVPGLTEADVLQMVEILPGVQSMDESAAGLHIRGGTPDQNLILWDGIPIYNSGHFFGMISAFNPFIVDKVKVFRGNFGAEYGGRVGGVIDIQSEEQIPEKIKVNAGLNFTNGDVSVVLPMFKKKAGLLLSARQSYTNILNSPTFKSLSNQLFNRGRIGREEVTEEEAAEIDVGLDFTFTDLNAKWWSRIGKKDAVYFSFFGIFDNLEYDYEEAEDEFLERDKVKLSNLGWSAKWDRQWTTNFSSTTKIIQTTFENDYQYAFRQRGAFLQGNNYVNKVRDWTLGWTNNWQLSPKTTLAFGWQFSDYLVQRNLLFDDNTGEENLDNHTLHTAFLSVKYQINNQLRGTIGLRYNQYTGLNQAYYEPRFSLYYLPNANWQFKLSVGRYQQVINQLLEFNELGFNQQLWILADAANAVPSVRSHHYLVGMFFHRPSFQLEIEAYYKRLSGVATWTDPLISDFTDDVVLTGNGRVKGVDFLLKKRWSTYQTWVSYSYSQISYSFDHINEANLFPAPQDRPHTLNIGHLLNVKNWQFSLGWKYATGRVFTQAEGLEIDEDAEDYYPVFKEEVINKSRLPHYHRLDASILYEINPTQKSWKTALGLSFLNLYNRKNILNRTFEAGSEEIDDETERSFLRALNQPSLRFTPNLVVRLEF